MKRRIGQRALLVVAFLAAVAALAGGVWRAGYVQGLDQLAARGEADLALAGDRLVGQLQRYRDTAVLIADHPAVLAALDGSGGAQETAALLLTTADKIAALDILVVDAEGQVVTSALGRVQGPLISAPHVARALRGALGWGHGAANPLTTRAFFHAAPVFDSAPPAGGEGADPATEVRGAVVVVTDLNGIDFNWRGTTPAAFFTDDGGRVYVSNRSELLFWRRPAGAAGLVPPLGPTVPFEIRQAGGHEIWDLAHGPYLPSRALHLTKPVPVIGMTSAVLLDVAPVRRLAMAQAAAVAALCLAFGSLLFLAAERRRALARLNAQLEGRVAARTAALRETNTKLMAEAYEREEAQQALRRAQDDLVQAGKLSALGQMSAGISHELNQPLMAIRSFAENATTFLERGAPDRAAENLGRISDMARRMGRIIQNLRAFARQDTGRAAPVELGKALASALDLTRQHASAAGVAITRDTPDSPLWVHGGEVRLGQVFVNLITNAVDAMADAPDKRLHITVRAGDRVEVRFRDTGPGIEMPDKVFDPFYTTKTGDQTAGMGLGLSISYGIVQSFGGDIKGSNHDAGGATFTVTLDAASPPSPPSARAPQKDHAA